MKLLHFAWVLSVLAYSAVGHAADLEKIDRTIKKEPVYQGKPRYCLLVFGPEKARVWVVVDGDVLYVDRNGNGDLTEEGERIQLPPLGPTNNPFCMRDRSVKVGDVTVGGFTHNDLVVGQMEYRRTMPGWQDDLDKLWRQVPDGVGYIVSVMLDPRCYGLFGEVHTRVKHLAFTDRGGHLAFTHRPREAPVVHFGGPLSLFAWPAKLQRGKTPSEVDYSLGTTGAGPGTFVRMAHDLVPDTVHPVAEFQFPRKGQAPVTEKYVLQRC